MAEEGLGKGAGVESEAGDGSAAAAPAADVVSVLCWKDILTVDWNKRHNGRAVAAAE